MDSPIEELQSSQRDFLHITLSSSTADIWGLKAEVAARVVGRVCVLGKVRGCRDTEDVTLSSRQRAAPFFTENLAPASRSKFNIPDVADVCWLDKEPTSAMADKRCHDDGYHLLKSTQVSLIQLWVCSQVKANTERTNQEIKSIIQTRSNIDSAAEIRKERKQMMTVCLCRLRGLNCCIIKAWGD